jgi:ribonuclease J
MQQVGRWLKRADDFPDQATDNNTQDAPVPEPFRHTGQFSSVTPGKLRVVPLGGLGEIGKNMMALEYGDDIIIVDAGVMFPEEDMPGVDLVIANTDYLMENRDKVRAILITHGHEDHTGAIPFVLPRLNVPVYAPRLAHGLIQVKLKEHRLLTASDLHQIEPGEVFTFGGFQAEFFRVCHSIPDAMGIAIHTPVGLVVHTGDFKFDHTPVDKKPTDFARLAELGIEGVTLLLADSTYAEMEGYTPSEAVIDEPLQRIMAEAPGRVMVATFASLIARIQQIANAADKAGRKVAVVGRSMVNNVAMAQQMGYLDIPDGVIVPWESLAALPMEKTVVIMTGAQGEPTSALTRVANHDHRDITLAEGDTIVFSASPIPGNEGLINKTIDNLLRQGTRVLHAKNAQVHVHGHASQEELKLMLRMIKPRFFVPIHGEYRHLVAHAGIAARMGVPKERIFVMEDGDVLELNDQDAKVVDRFPAGHIFVLGRRLWDPSNNVFKDRQSLGRDGVIVVALTVETATGDLKGMPAVTASGFEAPEDHDVIMAQACQRLKEVLGQQQWDQDQPENALKQRASDVLGKFLRDKTGRRPVVLVVVSQV